ncbi:MAG: GAF domain-containing protein [Spirochaetota bacterium]|nr:MAG: GAF domain-containing protein [Spirochaetota bacterium]
MKIQEYFKGSISESEILSKLLAAAAKITKSKRASILLYNGKMDELYIFKTMGWSKDEIKMLRGTKIQPGEGITGRVFLDGKPLIVNNIEKKTDFEPKDKYRSKSFVSVPILTDEAIIGVINLTEKESEIYSDKEMNILYFMINEISGRVKLPIGG